ncbi:MAG: hypothetical protein K5647_06640 [Clostridiales bacterium]|nr:hypothetical protein [Clostridiales bacterium]
MKKTIFFRSSIYLCAFIIILATLILPVLASSHENPGEEFDSTLNDALVILSQFKGASPQQYSNSFTFFDYPGLITEPQQSCKVPHKIPNNVIEVDANEVSEEILRDIYCGIFNNKTADILINNEKTGVIKYNGKLYQIRGWASTNSMKALKFVYQDSSNGFIPISVSSETTGNDRAIAKYSILFDSDFQEPFDYIRLDNMTVEFQKENGEWVISGGSLIELLFDDYIEAETNSSPHTGDDNVSLLDYLSIFAIASFVCCTTITMHHFKKTERTAI